MHDFVIAYHHSGDIHGQVTVAFQQVGDGEGEEYKGQQQDRIECLVVYIQPVQHKDGQLSEEITGCGTDNELYGKRAQYLGNSHSGGLDELNQHDCQHICHRVVTTAFQFQHGAQIMLQVHFCERRMANTEAESVDDMVDASKREVINGRWMLVQLMPDSHQIIIR